MKSYFLGDVIMAVETLSLKKKRVYEKKSGRGIRVCPFCNKRVGAKLEQCECGYHFLVGEMRKDLLPKKKKSMKNPPGKKTCPSCKKLMAIARKTCTNCGTDYLVVRKIRSIKEIIDEFEVGYYRMNSRVEKVHGGGQKRSIKTMFSEDMVDKFARGVWEYIGGDPKRMEIKKPRKLKIGNITVASDKPIFIDGNFVSVIEVKTYTDFAMFKRIMPDCKIVKDKYPDVSTYLFQLENALAGSTKDLENKSNANTSYAEFMNKPEYKNIDLVIVTFVLEGKRRYNEEVSKRISRKQIKKAFDLLAVDFKQYR